MTLASLYIWAMSRREISPMSFIIEINQNTVRIAFIRGFSPSGTKWRLVAQIAAIKQSKKETIRDYIMNIDPMNYRCNPLDF